ncbi:MAG TPA: type II toxin-antitoxin system VapB family antitoxin [Sulfuricella sp.]|nr:type II toxin-antitoxin system VapB family antitoxin [Sulfuricella sp.]
MQTAKLFMNGNSQAVRLPKEFRLEGDEVVVKKLGDAIMLMPKRYSYALLKASLDQFSPDFQIERDQPAKQQERDFS